MGTRYYMDEPDGEAYTVCDTVEDLQKEIKEIGYENWDAFKQATGVLSPYDILGTPWIIVDDRLLAGKWEDITIQVDKDGDKIRDVPCRPGEIYEDLCDLHSERYARRQDAAEAKEKLSEGFCFQASVEEVAQNSMAISAALDGDSDYEWTETFEMVGLDQAIMLEHAAAFVKAAGGHEKSAEIFLRASALMREAAALVGAALEVFEEEHDVEVEPLRKANEEDEGEE